MVRKRVFRVEEEIDAYMVEYGKKHGIKIHNQILPAIVRKLKKLEEEQFRSTQETNDIIKDPSPIDVPCPALIYIPNKGHYCAEKAPRIVHLPSLRICKYCLGAKQVQKITSITPKPFNFYKKPERIYCILDNIWLDPLKFQARCGRCKRTDIHKWAECQEYQRKLTQV